MVYFKFSGHGNYSHDYGWDNGVDLSTPEEINPVDAVIDYGAHFSEIPFLGLYVDEVECNEHGGSRNITLIVRAVNEADAEWYARQYCLAFYPEKYQD